MDEKPLRARLVKVPNFMQSINKLCVLADSQRLPWPFITDFKIGQYDIIIVGVAVENMSIAHLETRDHQIPPDYVIDLFNTRRMQLIDFKIAFRYGPYIFLIQERFPWSNKMQ